MLVTLQTALLIYYKDFELVFHISQNITVLIEINKVVYIVIIANITDRNFLLLKIIFTKVIIVWNDNILCEYMYMCVCVCNAHILRAIQRDFF